MSKLLVDEISDADNTGPVTVTDGLTVQGAFTSLGIDDNATSTAMTIDSSENVLVGKTAANNTTVGSVLYSSGAASHVASGGITTLFNRLTSDGDITVFQKDGTTVGSIATRGGDLLIGTGDTALRFSDGSSAITAQDITLNQGRDAAIDLGLSGTRFKDLYLSGGVYLGGTGAANYLSDVETGTWVPTYTASGTDFSSVTYNTLYTKGTYIKIGNTVIVRGYIRTEAITVGSPTGGVLIGGIPFTSSAGIATITDVRSRGSCSGFNFAAQGPSLVTSNNSSSYFYLYSTNAIGSGDSHVVVAAASAMATGTAKNNCTFTIAYVTDA